MSKFLAFPGLKFKELKPLSFLLCPKDLIITLFFMSVIAQISDNLKNLLVPKQIQAIPCIRFYSKIISRSRSSVSFSLLVSLSKTLGPELEMLSVLNSIERINYLQNVYGNLLKDRNTGKIFNNLSYLYNAENLVKHRKGLSLQCRTNLISTSLFSPHSIIQNVPISNVNLSYVLESAKAFWSSVGLDEREFDFLLRKEAKFCCNYFVDSLSFSNSMYNLVDCMKPIIYFELKQTLDIKDKLIFSEDNIILNKEDNLCLLERDLRFVERLYPNVHFIDTSFSDYDLKDSLLRSSLDQLRKSRTDFEIIYNNKKFRRHGYDRKTSF